MRAALRIVDTRGVAVELVLWLVRAELVGCGLPVAVMARRSGLMRATICVLLAGRVDCITAEVDAGLALLLGTPSGWWLWLAREGAGGWPAPG